MSTENPKIPPWARRERDSDLGWIWQNLAIFWTAALNAFDDIGRGAIVVDTTTQPIPDAGNPFTYLFQDQVAEQTNPIPSARRPGFPPLPPGPSQIRSSQKSVFSISFSSQRTARSAFPSPSPSPPNPPITYPVLTLRPQGARAPAGGTGRAIRVLLINPLAHHSPTQHPTQHDHVAKSRASLGHSACEGIRSRRLPGIMGPPFKVRRFCQTSSGVIQSRS